MTSPAIETEARASRDARDPGRGSDDQAPDRDPRQVGVLVLGGVPQGGEAGAAPTRHEAGRALRDPDLAGGTSSPLTDTIVFNLRPTEPGREAVGERSTFTNAFLVLLDEKGASSDQIIGLSVDADGAMADPVLSDEVVSRIGGVLQQHASHDLRSAGPRRLGDLTINPANREVHRGGQEIELTRTEFDMLDTLSARGGEVVTRRRLLEAAWGADWYGNDHVVDVHMSKLRRKLGDSTDAPRYIRTVRGVGFRIAPEAVSKATD